MLNNLGSLGIGNSNFAEVQAQMQQQVMSNPEFMRQMLDNPMVQSLMSNPDVIRDLMMSNPQMQTLIEVSGCFMFNMFLFQLFTFIAPFPNREILKFNICLIIHRLCVKQWSWRVIQLLYKNL